MIRKNIIGILVMILMASLVLAEPVFYITTDKDSYEVNEDIMVNVGINNLEDEQATIMGLSINVNQDFGDSFKDQAEVVDLGEQALYLNPLISMVSASKPYRWKYSSRLIAKFIDPVTPRDLLQFEIKSPHNSNNYQLNLDNSYYYNSEVVKTPIEGVIKNICIGANVDDEDNDGVCDFADNCQDVINPDQKDSDDDGSGDVCDEDDDNDSVVDEEDNCPLVFNADGQDADGDQDGIGDACDLDLDNDEVNNDEDNCPLVANADQSDFDDDNDGDACDADQDNDGVANDQDLCPNTPPEDQSDEDDNNLIDETGCGPLVDVDGDGIDDNIENPNCVYDPNGDGIADPMPTPEGLDAPNTFPEDSPFAGCIKGDLNLNHVVNSEDISWFIDYYGDRDNYDPDNPLPIDLNVDGGVNSGDIAEFIDAYQYR